MLQALQAVYRSLLQHTYKLEPALLPPHLKRVRPFRYPYANSEEPRLQHAEGSVTTPGRRRANRQHLTSELAFKSRLRLSTHATVQIGS
eukprot:6205540-Pleurochrysis_carterae.AAC.2